ncbi:MAG: Nif11-like leader peptide family natural product precursor [Candidatus Cybelea sp.]
MSLGGAPEFLKDLVHKNPDLRKALKGAILEEIVAAATVAGYEFTADDLMNALPGPLPAAHGPRSEWKYDGGPHLEP